MSLQFYFGGSGAGKSRQLQMDMLRWAEKDRDRNFLFLVPDQFTMQTQVDLVAASSHGGIMNIDVLSFGRLAHRIFEETGMGQETVLDDTGKSLVLRRVASTLSGNLPVIGKNLDKIGYIHEVKSAISEFMQYGLDVSKVGELVAFSAGRGMLSGKLSDLQKLYEAFLTYNRDKFVTTEETLELLTRAVAKSKIIEGSVIVFDGFTGFTPIQYRLIRELITLTERVIVSITIDIKEDPYKLCGEQELFYLSKKTVADLERIAKQEHIKRTDDIFIKWTPFSRFRETEALSHLEQNLFRYPHRAYEKETQSLEITEAIHPAAEVKETCIRIKKLVLEEGCCYRDIAVVTGDLATYGDYFEREALVYDIPFFMDRTRGLLLNPFIEYIRSALLILLRNFSYESVLHFLRCGLSDFTLEEVDLLENYVIACGIRGRKKWSEAFTREGAGEEELLKINELRERFFRQMSLLSGRRMQAGEMVSQLYAFIVQGKIQEKLAGFERFFQENGEPEKAREYAQIYRLVMELLEQIYALLEKEEMSLQEFADILDAGFGEIQVGTIPGSVDRVVVGDMERTRLKQVKVLFFLGVNDGNIPKGSSKGGIISDVDREFLQQSGMELAPTPRQQMYIQRLYLYMNMTKPSQKLYLSYSRISSQGKSIRPSYLIDVIRKLFPALEIQKSVQETSGLSQVIGPEDGLEFVARGLREYAAGRENGYEEEELFPLYHFYEQDPKLSNFAGKLAKAAFGRYRHHPLGKAVARALYGTQLENSVSRLERFAACAYAHFLEYGLMLKEREEYRFEQVDMGNVFHEVLEIFAGKLAKCGMSWFDFEEKEGDRLLLEAMQECTARYGETVLYSNARYEYMTERMYRILKRTIRTLKEQLRAGVFVPSAFELSFSRVEDPDAVDIALSPEERMKLKGRIDRVDTYEDENHVYVKVIDYKSGSHKFDLAAVYYGLQLQLVVYMKVAAKLEQSRHPDKEIVPAALLYYHVSDPMIVADKELTEEELNREIQKQLRMTGVVSAKEQVISLLDGDFTDKSLVIPVERKKDGSLSARSAVLEQQDYELISDFVSHKIRSFGRKILSGDIEINPCQQGNKDACAFCSFSQICEFEEAEGCRKRILAGGEEEELLQRMREEIKEE